MIPDGGRVSKRAALGFKAVESFSRVGDERSHVSRPHDEESDGLSKEVEEVVVFPEGQVVASTEEEVRSDSDLEQMDPVRFQCECRSS